MLKKIISYVIAFVIIAQSIIPISAATSEKKDINNQSCQEYIVKYKDGFDYKSATKELKEKKVKSLNKIRTLENEKYSLVSLPSTIDVNEYIKSVTDTDSIEYIVPDSYVRIFADQENFGIKSGEILEDYYSFVDSYVFKESKPVTIAVADTGVDFEVCNNIYINTNEIIANKVDDDGNSYKDDVNGWNFVDSNNITNADEIHGTVISNIISRCVPQAKILPLKVVKNGTAHISDIIDAIKYADSLGADIMNCSWGANEYNYALKDAMESSNMIFICAVDNDSTKISYPASFGLENTISVGKIGSSDNADVSFATDNIIASGPNNVVNSFSGTSYASAFITSAMALAINSEEEKVSSAVYGNALRNVLNNSVDTSNQFSFEKNFDDILGYIGENKNSELLMDITSTLKHDISDDIKYLLINGYPKLDNDEICKLAEYFNIDWKYMDNLNQNGFDLATSVSAIIFAKKIGIKDKDSCKLLVELGDYKEYKKNINELESLPNCLEISSDVLEKYINCLNKDISVIDIAGAMIIAKLQELDFNKIVNLDSHNSLNSIDFNKAQITTQNKTAYVRLIIEYNLSQDGLDYYIKNESLDVNMLVDKILQWQKDNNFYINDTEVDTFSSGNVEVPTVYNKYQMPSAQSNSSDVSVSDLYGMLTYKKDLISLAGKNGLDLNLSIRYDQDDAMGNNQFGDIDKLSPIYCGYYVCDAYLLDDIYFSNPFCTDILKWGEIYSDESLHNQMLQVTSFEDEVFTYIVKSASIIVQDTGYNFEEGKRSKSFYQELYSLGPGWSFNFPAVEDKRSYSNGNEIGNMILHFSDGQKYTVKNNSSTQDYTICGYKYSDITFSNVDSTTFVSGGRSSHWMVTYKNGRRDFLDSTGRYIGSSGTDIGANTERVEVNYNSDGNVSRIIDSVGRFIDISYNIVGIYDEDIDRTFYHRELNFDLCDINEETGKRICGINQYYKDTMQAYVVSTVDSYDNQGDKIKTIYYEYTDIDNDLLYNFRGCYIPDIPSSRKIYDCKSSVLIWIGSCYITNQTLIDTSATTKLEYENSYRNISNASCVNYARVSAISNSEIKYTYNNETESYETEYINKDKKEYVYEVIDKENKVSTEFIMNGWNDINLFNQNIDINLRRKIVFFPKALGFTFAVTIKETQDNDGNFCKATTNFYNDNRQLIKNCIYTLDASGNKTRYSQTDIEYIDDLPRKETTRRFGNGIELCLVKETEYDNYANIVESHVYTGTSQNSGVIQNIKKQEDVYRTYGSNKYIPIREEVVQCDATGTDQVYRVVTENTIASSGNDITQQRTYYKDETNQVVISNYKDTIYTYDDYYFNLKKVVEHDEGEYEGFKNTVYSYDSKYGIYKSEVIHSSEIPEEYLNGKTQDFQYDSHCYYEYDKFGRVTKLKNGDDTHSTLYAYDSLNSIISTIYPNGVESYQSIDYKKNMVIQTNTAVSNINSIKEGTKLKYVYDYFGKLIEEYIQNNIGEFILSKKYEYDKNNRLITTYQFKNEDSSDYIKISKSYDSIDRITSIKTYDSKNNIIAHEDYSYEIVMFNEIPCEKQTITTYNGESLPLKTIEYMNSAGNVVAQQIEYMQNQFYTNTYTYGNYGYIISQQGDTIDKKQFVYDSLGNLIKEIDCNNKIKTYTYDAYKRVRQIINEKGESSFYEYDSLDRVTCIRQFVGTISVMRDGQQYEEPCYSYLINEYDIYGNKVKVKISNSELGAPLTFSETKYSYDKNDQLVMVEQVLSPTESYFSQYYYDEAGRKVREYTGLKKPLVIKGLDSYQNTGDYEFSVKKFEYDYKGNLIKTIFPDGIQESYSYSFDNLLLKKAVNNSQVIEYKYDNLGRVIYEYADDKNYKNYKYDSIGNLISVGDANETITYTYNLIGKPLTETRTTSNDDSDYIIKYNYSPRGISDFSLSLLNNKKNDYEEKYYQSYIYDSFGRILTTNQRNSINSANNYTISYSYDSKGEILSENVITPNCNSLKVMEYNGLGQIIKSSQTTENNSVNDISTFKYRLDGNMIEKSENQQRTKYSYDNIGRLKIENNYDLLSNKVLNRVDFSYDEYNNCIDRYECNDIQIIDTYCEYNKSNQLTLKSIEINDAYFARDSASISYSYSYDSRGNNIGYSTNYSEEVPDEEKITYSYDAFNQLISGLSNIKSFQYEYDVIGRRISKSGWDGANKEYQYWFGDDIILDKNTSYNSITEYVFGNNICGISKNSKNYIYETNAHNDVTGIIDESKSGLYSYESYGSRKEINGKDISILYDNPYRYGGYYYDKESELYYLNARYYDSQSATFTQRDTYTGEIENPSTLNLYMYCAGNPILYTDPTGHFFDTVLDIVSVGFSAHEFVKKPSISNGLWLAADVASLAIPFIPATGVLRAAKGVVKTADMFVDTSRVIKIADKIYDAGKVINSTIDGYRNFDRIKDSTETTLSISKTISSYSDEAAAAIKAANAEIKEKNKKALIESIAANKGGNEVISKPNQLHHFATNKNKTYTPQLKEVANKYNLKLNGSWNKEMLPHQGRHPNEYHEYVLNSMKQFDEIAQGNKDIFLKLYDGLKKNISSNPEMLYKNYWK